MVLLQFLASIIGGGYLYRVPKPNSPDREFGSADWHPATLKTKVVGGRGGAGGEGFRAPRAPQRPLNFRNPVCPCYCGRNQSYQRVPGTRVMPRTLFPAIHWGGDFRIPNCNEIALELVCGADFCCNRHCRTSPRRTRGVLGPSSAENRPKT